MPAETVNAKIRHSSNSGFTLTEVVVASGLLLIAIVPILRALTHVNTNRIIIEQRTKSLSLAQGRLNEIMARSINNFDSNFNTSSESLGNSYFCSVSQTKKSANLKAVTVLVGVDRDSNSKLDSDEVQISLQSQIVRRESTAADDRSSPAFFTPSPASPFF